MDFMLMMGVAGDEREGRLHATRLDLFHTMEAYFTWYPKAARMSKYLLNKFLYTVDRDPELVERLPRGPARHGGLVGGRARQRHPQLPGGGGAAPGCAFTDAEREALRDSRSTSTLFELGRAQLPDPDPVHRHVRARLRRAAGFQLEYARKLSHFSLPYPGHLHLSGRPCGFLR